MRRKYFRIEKVEQCKEKVEQKMALLRNLFVFYIILQILHSYDCSIPEKQFTKNQKSTNSLPSKNLHIFAEKFKPFLYEADDNHTYIGINYFLIKTIGEHLNMEISLDLASNENRLENWKPVLMCVVIHSLNKN